MFLENVVEIDSLNEDMEKISLKDSPTLQDMPKGVEEIEVQEVEVETTQPLPKDWRFNPHHPKDLIIGEVSKGVTTRSKLHDLCGHYAFISHFEPKNTSKPRATHIGCLPCKRSSINSSATKFVILFPGPMIDQQLVLNRFLGTSW